MSDEERKTTWHTAATLPTTGSTQCYSISFDPKTNKQSLIETGLATSEYKFCIGRQVEKFKGDYQCKGEVRACFKTQAGKIRYVVEHKAEGGGSFLHIYNEDQLRSINDTS